MLASTIGAPEEVNTCPETAIWEEEITGNKPKKSNRVNAAKKDENFSSILSSRFIE